MSKILGKVAQGRVWLHSRRLPRQLRTTEVYGPKSSCDILFLCMQSCSTEAIRLELSQVDPITLSFALLRTNERVHDAKGLVGQPYQSSTHVLSNSKRDRELQDYQDIQRTPRGAWGRIAWQANKIILGIGSFDRAGWEMVNSSEISSLSLRTPMS
jgi:hypothetical protein